MFYHFSQNNTGGSFVLTDNLTHFVVIEADNAAEANGKLVSLGGYFDGCESGVDCSCCGDRWYPVDENDAEDQPNIYGEHFTKFDEGKFSHRWMEPGKEIVVHFSGAPAEWF